MPHCQFPDQPLIDRRLEREVKRIERANVRKVGDLQRHLGSFGLLGVDLPAQEARALATVRFETPPGQQVQIDFGEKTVEIAGQRVKVYLMTAVLGYSRRLYCRAFLAQRQDDWLEGLEGAFRHFGGLPEEVLCDNASPLVISHNCQSGEVVWNPAFEAFCRDRGLENRRRLSPRKGRELLDRGAGTTWCGLRALQHIPLTLPRFVKLSNRAAHEIDISLELAGRRKLFQK
jgi:hypothetical protein